MRSLFVLLAVAAPARAEKGTKNALVLPPTWKGEFSDTEKITIVASLSASMAAQGYAVVEERLRDASIEGDARLAQCLGTVECKVELAERLDAEMAIAATVTRSAGAKKDQKAEWLVTIAVLPLDVRRLGATDLRRCASCNAAQVEPIITSLVGEVLARERKRGRATLAVRSLPPGARVTLDGATVGKTDLSRVVYAESHVLEVDADGKHGEKRFEVAAGRTIALRADLSAGTIVEEGGGGGGRISRPLGVAALIAGLAAAAGGVALLALNGKGTCTLAPPQEQCPQRYDNLAPGVALTVGGGILAVVGAILVVAGRF